MEVPSTDELFRCLGLADEPFGMYYADEEPAVSIAPKPSVLPSVEDEAAGTVDWQSIHLSFACVLGVMWRARKKNCAAVFDRQRFGCLGGAFYLGFLKPQLDMVARYVSTGIPNQMEGERYLRSAEVARHFFETIDPRPAPARYCIFKPIGQFSQGDRPELIVFFGRPECIAGLHQLATFVTDDFEVVSSPFGSGCSTIVTWPLYYLAQGKPRAVIGCWDPSDRKFLRPDEITFTVPAVLFDLMLNRWRDSFLTTSTWRVVRQRVDRSKRVWGEE